MKKKLTAVLLTAILAITMSAPAFASGWMKGQGKNSEKWWYQSNNGSTYLTGWQWLDGNGDGISECYYFDYNGWLLVNTTTPDGSTVNENGAWTVNGTVQTRSSADSGFVDNALTTNITTNTPASSIGYAAFTDKETAGGETWAEGFTLKGSPYGSGSQVTFKFAKQYTNMTLTFAPAAGQSGTAQGKVIVKGLTTGKTLATSDTISLTSAPKAMKIDIRYEDGIQISLYRGFEFMFKDLKVQ